MQCGVLNETRLWDMCQYITCVWLLANRQTNIKPADVPWTILYRVTLALGWKTTFFSPQLKQDITVRSVTPAPPCINPMSECLQQVTWTLLNHAERQSPLTLATATQRPNHLSTQSTLLVALRSSITPFFTESITLSQSLVLAPLSFWGHWPLASNC